jgi:cation diffusion facilitator CzcD-associated flavoprotein CzcO
LIFFCLGERGEGEKKKEKKMKENKTAIIGGGGVGICALNEATKAGLDVTLFEAESSLGGVWTTQGEASRAYFSLTTNSSRKANELHDFPLKDEPGEFMSHWELKAYYASIAEACSQSGQSKICLDSKVTCLERRPLDGKFLVEVNDSGTVQVFDHVIVGTGTFMEPFLEIDWLPQLKYSIPWIHAASYREPRWFAGKHVVVIGIGNSALDISLDLAFEASHVTVCSNGASILPVWDDANWYRDLVFVFYLF